MLDLGHTRLCIYYHAAELVHVEDALILADAALAEALLAEARAESPLK